MRLRYPAHPPRRTNARTLTTACTAAIVTALTASTLMHTASAQEDGPADQTTEGITDTANLLDRASEGTSDAPEPTNRFLVSYHPSASNTPEAREGTMTQALEEIGAEPEASELRETATGATVFETSEELSPEQSEELLAQLRDDDSVEYAEIDAIFTIAQDAPAEDRDQEASPAAAPPNDTHFPRQWALTERQGINVLPAWDVTRGQGQTVAVIDSGIAPHRDLNANVTGGYDFISDSSRARDGDGRDSDPTDEGDWITAGQCGNNQPANSSWHGTHVAGTVAAVAGNNEGIAGVAPDSTIVPLRVLGACGGYLSDITDAVVWAAGGTVRGAPANQNVADVINMSLGGSGQCSATYQRAIDLAVNRGSVVVVAAGNENRDASLVQPASCNNTVTVGAVDANGARAPYSNYGSTVDVWAPGGNTAAGQGVLSTIDTGRTTRAGAGYGNYQGTSMAAPHVAGVAALVTAANPGISTAELTSRITQNTNARNVIQAPAAVGAGTNPGEPVDPEDPVDPVDPEEPPVDDAGTAALVDATNRARASAGLPPLAARPELTRLAQDWAQTMSQRNQLVHRPDLREHTTAEYAVSENILMTRGRATSAEDMVRMWMNSPGHRANILDRNARWIGVGIAESANGTTYAVQNFGVARR